MSPDSISNKASEIYEDLAMVLNGYIKNCEKKEGSLHEVQLAQISSISNLLSVCLANFCVASGHDLQDILKDIIPIINKVSYDQHKEKIELMGKLKDLLESIKGDPRSACSKLKNFFELSNQTPSVH